MTSYPVINLHNDLLGCVEADEKKFNFCSPEVCCSVPQVQAGNVRIEVLAIAAVTAPDSAKKASRQLELYHNLLKDCSEHVCSLKDYKVTSQKTHFLFGIENASTLGNEADSFEKIIERFEKIQQTERVLYIGLTWNQENIFGGGNRTQIGLKAYGEKLLFYLDKKNIAIDFSHTSDALAYDILNYIEKNNLKIPLIASHSNLRAICPVARNLPDEIAQELYKQKAVTGINFVRHFVGNDPEDYIKHIEHALKLGGEDALALGADFFGGFVLPPELSSNLELPMFQEGFDDASCFPKFLHLLEKNFSSQIVEKIAYKNALNFLNRTLPFNLNMQVDKATT